MGWQGIGANSGGDKKVFRRLSFQLPDQGRMSPEGSRKVDSKKASSHSWFNYAAFGQALTMAFAFKYAQAINQLALLPSFQWQ